MKPLVGMTPLLGGPLRRFLPLLFIALFACAKPEPLTPQLAEALIRDRVIEVEPVYAEVPQRVWYGPKSPQDDYDRLAERTLRNLERVGLITVSQEKSADGMTTVQGKFTPLGFRTLGTMPSARGPVFRGRICEKRFDGVRNFVRHPSQPTIGSAELVWHYENPTPLYELYETKINKPLNKPFASLVSFYWKNRSWNFNITVAKTASAS